MGCAAVPCTSRAVSSMSASAAQVRNCSHLQFYTYVAQKRPICLCTASDVVQTQRAKDAKAAVLAARRRLRQARGTPEATQRLAASNSDFMSLAARSLMRVRDGQGSVHVGVGDATGGWGGDRGAGELAAGVLCFDEMQVLLLSDGHLAVADFIDKRQCKSLCHKLVRVGAYTCGIAVVTGTRQQRRRTMLDAKPRESASRLHTHQSAGQERI